MYKPIVFLTKAELYEKINNKFDELELNPFSINFRIDSKELAKKVCLNLEIVQMNFEESKICGILYKGKNSTTIGLNARRSAFGQNFDCMHELIHYWYHDEPNYFCMPMDIINNNKEEAHLEWQANEGAAQFLMPYQSFIPAYSNAHDRFYARRSTENAYEAIIDHLAKTYLVGRLAAAYRINGLSKEISQYINGTEIQNIKVLSKNSKA